MSDDDLAIPAFLIRKDTPESRARRDEITGQMQRGRRPVGKYRPAVSAGRSETKLQETEMAKIGKKEAALREARASDKSDVPMLSALLPKVGKAKAKKPDETAAAMQKLTGVTETTDVPNSEIFGGDLGPDPKPVRAEPKAAKKTAAKPVGKPGKAAKPPAKGKTAKPEKPAGKAPKPKAGSKEGYRPDGLREGSKQAVMLDMAKRKDGASEKEICKKLGWKKCRVTLGRVVKRVGGKLEARKVGDVTTYFAKL